MIQRIGTQQGNGLVSGCWTPTARCWQDYLVWQNNSNNTRGSTATGTRCDYEGACWMRTVRQEFITSLSRKLRTATRNALWWSLRKGDTQPRIKEGSAKGTLEISPQLTALGT